MLIWAVQCLLPAHLFENISAISTIPWLHAAESLSDFGILYFAST